MKVSTEGQSRFVSRVDLPAPVIVTMDNVVEDRSLRNPYVLQFIGDILKPLPLNLTNRRIIVAIHGDDPEAWYGQPLEVYFDPSVPNPRDPSRPGGVKVRIPARAPTAPARPMTVQTAPAAGAAPNPAPLGRPATPAKPLAPRQKVYNIEEKHAGVLRGYANAKDERMVQEVAAWAEKQDFAPVHHEAQADAYNAALDRLGIGIDAEYGDIPF